jgi:hypothetical protein
MPTYKRAWNESWTDSAPPVLKPSGPPKPSYAFALETPMKYAITPVVRHRADPIEITEDEYRAIATAKDGLIAFIGIEQKFDLVLENYAEYERELLALAVHQVVFRDVSYSSFQRETLTVVRRLSNLLSSCRLYIDQIKHDLASTFGGSHAVIRRVNVKCSEEYDSKLGFRLMETLRNVMQHRSLSGFVLKYSNDADPPGPQALLRTRIVPLLEVDDLREAGIKAAVGEELAGSEYAEVSSKVREYVQGIANVHYEFREAAAHERQDWANVYRSAYERGNAAWAKGEIRGSDLIAVDEADTIRESRHVLLEPLDYLASLERKNAGPLALVRSYVSNMFETDDA